MATTLAVSETLSMVSSTGIRAPKSYSPADRIDFPVFVKPDASGHKADRGLVIEAKDGRELELAISKISPEKPIIQEKLVGTELIFGAKRDPVFGTVVLVGIGGTFSEVYSDVSTASYPFGEEDALSMLGSLKGQKILDGFRGKPKVDRLAVAKALVALGGLAEQEKVLELDLNPVICVKDGGLVAVDGRALVDR